VVVQVVLGDLDQTQLDLDTLEVLVVVALHHLHGQIMVLLQTLEILLPMILHNQFPFRVLLVVLMDHMLQTMQVKMLPLVAVVLVVVVLMVVVVMVELEALEFA
tara:strand:+ start:198 stop:509 length:312 start_codon:yes stop_codon:yes gene_type:complete